MNVINHPSSRRAARFEVYECAGGCAVHIAAFDCFDNLITEITMGVDSAENTANFMLDVVQGRRQRNGR